MLGLPQQRVFCLDGYGDGQSLQFAWRPKSAAWFEFAGMESDWRELSSLDGVHRVTDTGRILRGICLDD